MSCILAGLEHVQPGTTPGMYIDDDFIGVTHRSCFASIKNIHTKILYYIHYQNKFIAIEIIFKVFEKFNFISRLAIT